MGLNAEEFGMSAKAQDLIRQQYLVPRKSVKKLREMSRREGVSVGKVARRAIGAYTFTMLDDGTLLVCACSHAAFGDEGTDVGNYVGAASANYQEGDPVRLLRRDPSAS